MNGKGEWVAYSETLNKIVVINSSNAIGHFTQMAQDRSSQVGCGLATYKSGGFYWNLLACNYARTNIMNQPVYVSSEVAGSECQSGKNPTYPALCGANEGVNPNY